MSEPPQPHADRLYEVKHDGYRPVASACQLGFDGVIGKRRAAPYRSRRSADWIELKCAHRQAFVICGHTDPQGARRDFGALLLGVHDNDDGALRFAGSVGTGLTEQSLRELGQRLRALETDEPPFANPADRKSIPAEGRHWVEPRLLAEVSFAQWTGAQRVRHAVFHGLRADKPPCAIMRERPALPEKITPKTALAPIPPASSAILFDDLPQSLRVTHPERVVDARTGATKLDLLRYWAQGAAARPIPGVRRIDAGDAGVLPKIDDTEGLLQLAQRNAVELHTWNAASRTLARPDRIVFDLDPGARVAFAQVRDAALLVRTLLDEPGLSAFLKTSCGKGLHPVVPIERRHGTQAVKDFSGHVVQHLARTISARFALVSGARNRVGKIFVDYLRNGFGATTVCAWSLRARPALGVSVPIDWDEFGSIDSGAHWALHNVDERRGSVGNVPWRDYEAERRSFGPASKKLAGVRPAARNR